MTSFEEFWNKLVENDIWYDIVRMRFHKKDVKKCAGDAFVYLLADGKLIETNDVIAWRKYLTSWLIKAPDAPVTPQLQQVEEPRVETDPAKQPIPKSDPRYDNYLKLWQAKIDEYAVNHPIPKLTKDQIKVEGQTDKPRPPIYKSDEEDFLYHLKQNIKRFAGKKYKKYYKWDGFKYFNIGLVTVYAESINDANDILTKAERYTRMKLK